MEKAISTAGSTLFFKTNQKFFQGEENRCQVPQIDDVYVTEPRDILLNRWEKGRTPRLESLEVQFRRKWKRCGPNSEFEDALITSGEIRRYSVQTKYRYLHDEKLLADNDFKTRHESNLITLQALRKEIHDCRFHLNEKQRCNTDLQAEIGATREQIARRESEIYASARDC